MFPRARLTDGRDHLLPTLPDGRILLDGREWEMPTPQNVDVFVDRLARAGLLVVDPLVEDLRHDGAVRGHAGADGAEPVPAGRRGVAAHGGGDRARAVRRPAGCATARRSRTWSPTPATTTSRT